MTSGDIAQVLIVMANVVDGDDRLPTLFLIESDAPGVEYVDDPPFTHNYPEGHPAIRFTEVEVGEDAVVGEVGAGNELQRKWFTEERLAIAARGVGAMWRLLDGETVAWACERRQGSRIFDYQGLASRSPTRPPTRRPGGCSRSRWRRSPAPGPTRRSSITRRRWRSCSSPRRLGAAPTAACRPSAGAATCTNVAERLREPRGGPDLGGHERDPAADRRPRPRRRRGPGAYCT